MNIVPIPGPFGVSVSGVDLAADMSEAAMVTLIGLLHAHQILAIAGQKLDLADYVRFGYFWGRPLLYPRKSDTHDEFSEMIRIGNPTSTPERDRNSAIHWHSDGSYEEIPAAVTLLYGLEAPECGGETGFASTALAYEALPDDTKQRIDGLIGLHCLSGAPLPGEIFAMFPEATARHGITRHPLVMRHPVTGRKAIYTSGTAFGAEGLEADQGRALIAELRAHVTNPQFATRYKVRAGDILLWDNLQTMHTATHVEYSDEPNKRRLLYRISTRGVPDLCAPLPAA